MPCLFALLVLAFPRAAIALLWLTGFFSHVYSLFVLILGFVFLPLTTIVYAWIVNQRHPIGGINLVFLLLAVAADLGMVGGARAHTRRRG